MLFFGWCRYQTGALTPLVRWLQQGMQRAAAPPQPPRPDARLDNLPPGARQGNENAAGPGIFLLASLSSITSTWVFENSDAKPQYWFD